MRKTVIVDSLVKAIKEYILDGEDRAEIVHKLERYKKEFRNYRGYNWYAYGNILPYYYQIREFYVNNGLTPSEDNAILQRHFEKHIERAIDEILKENK